jgi:hypothetical protein
MLFEKEQDILLDKIKIYNENKEKGIKGWIDIWYFHDGQIRDLELTDPLIIGKYYAGTIREIDKECTIYEIRIIFSLDEIKDQLYYPNIYKFGNKYTKIINNVPLKLLSYRCHPLQFIKS